MEEEKLLPKPQVDLPLPEKQIPAKSASQGQALGSRLHLPKYLFLATIFVVLLLIIGAAFLGGKYYLNQQKLKAINNFESCAAAGNPIQESYPATCRTSDGRSFTQVLSEEEQKNLLPPDPTADWKTFNSADFGIEFKYPKTYEIISNTNKSIVLGFKDTTGNGPFPYLMIGKQKTINYSTLKTCSADTQNEPCLNGASSGNQDKELLEQDLSGKKAISFFATEGLNSDFHFIQTLEDPSIEFKMNVAGGGLEATFDQILSTLKFKDPQLSCAPRPACFDSKPRCLIAETEDMCPPSPMPSF